MVDEGSESMISEYPQYGSSTDYFKAVKVTSRYAKLGNLRVVYKTFGASKHETASRVSQLLRASLILDATRYLCRMLLIT
jgi:hypothetical protein